MIVIPILVKNELTNEANQNYLQLNYQFKYRYLNENVPEIDKTMEPIDLSIKRTSPEINSSNKLIEQQKSSFPKEHHHNHHQTKQNGVKSDRQTNNSKLNENEHIKNQLNSLMNSTKNEAKLLPYLLMSNNNHQTTKLSENKKPDKIDELSIADTDLSLKYNKKKLFLASVRKRKQSSSTDNSNLSTNGTTLSSFSSSSSSSSSSNSPNSTPSSSTTHHQLINADRRNSCSTTSSTNLSLSPNSDNHDELDNQHQAIKDFDLYQAQKQQTLLAGKNKLFDSGRLYNFPFNKKFEYFSKHYKLTELKDNKHSNKNGDSSLLNGKSSSINSSNNNGNLIKGKNNLSPHDKPTNQANGTSKDNYYYLKCLKSFQRCNKLVVDKQSKASLRRSVSESQLINQKQKITINLLIYKRKQLKRWNSESDLNEFERCNQEKQSIKQTNNNSNNQLSKEILNEEINLQIKQQQQKQQQQLSNDQLNKQLNGQQQLHSSNGKESHLIDYKQFKVDDDEFKIYENEMLKKQLIDKQMLKEQELYLRNHHQMIKDEDLLNYTKQLIRTNQKGFYQFNQFKSNSLPLNLQLNRTKTSLTFNNSQLFNKKALINGQCAKLNEKTGLGVVGKRKFTKLASDEDEEDLEEDDENEENIIVDNLSNTASSSVSPSSIQSNSDSSIINKQLLANHHLDHQSHNENSIDLRLPFLNHSAHLTNHLTSLTRRSIPNKQLANFGNHLPNDLLSNDLLQNEVTTNLSSTNSKDELASWKFYKDYYYLLLNQPDSPAKLNALQWIMKDLNEKNNNHINLTDEWADQELIKLNHAYKQSYSIENNSPLNLTMFNNLNRSTNSLIDQTQHRQLLNTSRLDKFTTNSPQPINLANMQLTPDNYLQYVKMNENLLNNNNRHLNNGNQLQILTGQSYLNLESGNNHCLPAGTPNSFQGILKV